jgi:cytochrome b subunit of formate dehydrogenase
VRSGAAWAAAAALAWASPAPAPAQEQLPREPANRACLECHGQPHLAELSASERRVMLAVPADDAAPRDDAESARPGLYLGLQPLRNSMHADLLCVDCHPDARVLPHPLRQGPATCNGQCHVQAQADFERSSHAESLAAGDANAPTCATCHGGHRILGVEERQSLTHPFHAVHVCGNCHKTHTAPLSNGVDAQQHVQSYLDSVHGQGISAGGLVFAATCPDCHRHHEVRPASDPQASTHRLRIPTTCGGCHLGVVETYQTSIHGTLLAEGDERAPVCTNCHTAHQITHAWTPAALVDIVAECGECHDRPEMSRGRRATFYKTYRTSYHGQVTRLGGTRAARCSDCHGAHDILPIDEERSRLHVDARIATCRRCHEGANARFAEFDPHADYLDRKHYPLLNAIWWYFIILMGCAFGFFGAHSLLWFVRSLIERRRLGPPPRTSANPHAIQRFTTLNRINHALLIIAFFGLTLTGLPLLLSDYDWARTLAGYLGGGNGVGVLHRSFAVLLVGNFVIHGIGLARKARRHEGSLVQDWLRGPSTLLPRLRDFKDCAGMFRWFLRGGKQPSFDRWTYWEKFDYLAEFIGIGIIGGSGFLLWFPEFFSSFLPGWIFNVAMIVHGYEALLAVGFIFTIHFFNAHLRMEKFPVDDVIFTGQLSEEELSRERADEYARLVATGQLEALRVPPAPHWQRKLAVVVGVAAMAVGFTLVALIIMAGLEAL